MSIKLRVKRLLRVEKDKVPEFESRALLELILQESQVVNRRKDKPNYSAIAHSYAASPEQEEFLAEFGSELGTVNEAYDDKAKEKYRDANSWYEFDKRVPSNEPPIEVRTFFFFLVALALGMGTAYAALIVSSLMLILPSILTDLALILGGGYLTYRFFRVLMVGPITAFQVHQIEKDRQEELEMVVDKYFSRVRRLPEEVKNPELYGNQIPLLPAEK